MQQHLAIGALGVAAVLGTLALFAASGDPSGPVDRTDPADPANPLAPRGHLILLIEGDARGLRVTHVTAKKDPYNPVDGKASHEIVIYDTTARVLGRYPLDLSKFDLDPAHVGKPLRVEGCEVIDTKVVMLASIPWLPNAAALEIEKGAVPVGGAVSADYARLVAAAERTLEGQR